MKTLKDLIIEVRNFCISDDETRPYLNGIYFDETGVSVATDGYVLSHSRMLFEEKLKGLLIGENLKVIERDFPKWKLLLPSKFTNKVNAIKLNKNLLKKSKKALERTIYFDGENFKFDKPEKFEFAIDSKLLTPLLKDETIINIEWNNALQAIKIVFSDSMPDEFMIVMPIKT